MTMNCHHCGTEVAGLDVHVLPRGHEQPTPRVFHQRCLSEYEANTLSKIERLEELVDRETLDEVIRTTLTQWERIRAVIATENESC